MCIRDRDSTAGREREEEPCELRTAFQRDRDRIMHCKAFRRLKHKTQVFLSPEGDHYRTRLTHTLEVSQIARTIARALRLNEDLTEAIALGHDLGHTPVSYTHLDVYKRQGFSEGGAVAFPFLKNLFSGMPKGEESASEKKEKEQKTNKNAKRKILESHCINLVARRCV